MAVAVSQGFEQRTCFAGTRLLAAVAGSIEPPDLARRFFRGQHMEHCEHGRRDDAATQEDDGRAARPTREVCARRANVRSQMHPVRREGDSTCRTWLQTD